MDDPRELAKKTTAVAAGNGIPDVQFSASHFTEPAQLPYKRDKHEEILKL
jgi:hypothetical protein